MAALGRSGFGQVPPFPLCPAPDSTGREVSVRAADIAQPGRAALVRWEHVQFEVRQQGPAHCSQWRRPLRGVPLGPRPLGCAA
jgi:hypothetical protein